MLEKVKKSQVRWKKASEVIGPERLVKRVYKVEMEGRRAKMTECLNNQGSTAVATWTKCKCHNKLASYCTLC